MFKYIPRQIFQKVMVIGCGGTGSRLVPMLTQFLRSITKEHTPGGWLETPTIYLVDDDVVETKNLLRQNFIEADVGKNKATVLAQRYGRAYGMNLVPVPKRINTGSLFEAVMEGTTDEYFNGSNAMFILCVDSAKARRDILRLLESIPGESNGRSPFVIDAGNENNFGQVKLFHMSTLMGDDVQIAKIKKMGIPPMFVETPVIDFLPYPYKFYQDLQDNPGQGSCADLDQTLAINASMATTIMGVVQNFYYVKPFMFNEISISLDGAGYTTYNTIQNFVSKITLHYGRGGRMPAFDVISGCISKAKKDIANLEALALKASAAAQTAELSKELLGEEVAPDTEKKPKASEKAVASETPAVPDLHIVGALPPSEVPQLIRL